MTHAHQPAEVTMPDPFDPTKLVITKAQAADRAAQELERDRAARTAQRHQRAQPVPASLIAALTGEPLSRAERQVARVYANAWYLALRRWSTREVKLIGSFHYDDRDPTPDLLLFGNARPLPTVYLATPAGEFDEANVGRLITDMTRSGLTETILLGRMLERLRRDDNGCMAELLRPDMRWHQHRERAIRYAVAVLTLAVKLGVQEAESPLQRVKTELAALAG